jgi:hypothetical protein
MLVHFNDKDMNFEGNYLYVLRKSKYSDIERLDFYTEFIKSNMIVK